MARFARLLVIASLGAGWLACVSADPGPSASSGTADGGRAVGDRLGPCFPDGKCKDGLLCRDGEICLTPDEPKPATDGGGDGTGVDASPSGDGSVDGSTDGGTCAVPGSDKGPKCVAGTCAGGTACCQPSTGGPQVCVQQASPNCPPDAAVWACEQSNQCQATLPMCCVSGQLATGGRCGLTLQVGTSSCMAPTTGGTMTCDGNSRFEACPADGKCSTPFKVCKPVEVQTRLGFSIVVRLCVVSP